MHCSVQTLSYLDHSSLTGQVMELDHISGRRTAEKRVMHCPYAQSNILPATAVHPRHLAAWYCSYYDSNQKMADEVMIVDRSH